MTKRPQWLYIAPFLLNPPELTQRQWQILGTVAIVSAFATYDAALLQLALPQIQAGLNVGDADLSNIGAAIKLGALPALLLLWAADWVGRRQLLLVSVVAYTLLTGATAFAPSPSVFVTLQFLARTFFLAEAMLAAVIISEEFPAEARGWGIGALVALGTYGGGLAVVFYSLIEILPFGWRTLYFAGFLPLIFLPRLRNALPETARFEQQVDSEHIRHSMRTLLNPLVSLVRAYPRRFLTLAAITFLLNFGGDAAFFYDPTYLQQAHQWRPFHVSLLQMTTGFMAVLGSTYAGALGDRFGRRRTTIFFLTTAILLAIAFYNVSGWWLPICWAGWTFMAMGTAVSLSTYETELFPTSYRSTASGVNSAVATIGGTLSLMVHGLLFGWLGSQWGAVTLLALTMVLAPLIVLAFPETSGRTLEEISPER